MITISCCTRNCHTHKPNIGIGKGKLIGKDYVKEKGKTTMNYCGQFVLLNSQKNTEGVCIKEYMSRHGNPSARLLYHNITTDYQANNMHTLGTLMWNIILICAKYKIVLNELTRDTIIPLEHHRGSQWSAPQRPRLQQSTGWRNGLRSRSQFARSAQLRW